MVAKVEVVIENYMVQVVQVNVDMVQDFNIYAEVNDYSYQTVMMQDHYLKYSVDVGN